MSVVEAVTTRSSVVTSCSVTRSACSRAISSAEHHNHSALAEVSFARTFTPIAACSERYARELLSATHRAEDSPSPARLPDVADWRGPRTIAEVKSDSR